MPTNGLIRHLLTERQLAVLNCCVEKELVTKDIANDLCVGKKTIDAHILEINKKYKTGSFMVAVIRYMKELQQ